MARERAAPPHNTSVFAMLDSKAWIAPNAFVHLELHGLTDQQHKIKPMRWLFAPTKELAIHPLDFVVVPRGLLALLANSYVFIESKCDFLSLGACPTGADPYETGKVDEQQTITCTADGGSFTLSFRQYTTASISASANLPTVQAALQALPTIVTATVTFSTGSTVCSTSGVGTMD
ncbi:unnamed protein product [Aphanomyces euteiches]